MFAQRSLNVPWVFHKRSQEDKKVTGTKSSVACLSASFYSANDAFNTSAISRSSGDSVSPLPACGPPTPLASVANPRSGPSPPYGGSIQVPRWCKQASDGVDLGSHTHTHTHTHTFILTLTLTLTLRVTATLGVMYNIKPQQSALLFDNSPHFYFR
jgi:hypothetical protein